MQNADTPAMPIELSGFGQCAPEAYTGLTKREELASRNLAAILSSLPHWESLGYLIADDSEYARQAIAAADALLAELEKKDEK